MINIQKILEKEPTLMPFGIEGPGTFRSDDKEFDDDYMQQIQTCMDWLKEREVAKDINYNSTSYGIKHIIEREVKTYVSNGCFIAAVIGLGIPYKTIPLSPNIYVQISKKELYKNDPNQSYNIYEPTESFLHSEEVINF